METTGCPDLIQDPDDGEFMYIDSPLITTASLPSTESSTRDPSPERLSTFRCSPEDIFKPPERTHQDMLFPDQIQHFIAQIRGQRQMAEASALYMQAIEALQAQRPKTRKEQALERIRRKLAQKRERQLFHDQE